MVQKVKSDESVKNLAKIMCPHALLSQAWSHLLYCIHLALGLVFTVDNFLVFLMTLKVFGNCSIRVFGPHDG